MATSSMHFGTNTSVNYVGVSKEKPTAIIHSKKLQHQTFQHTIWKYQLMLKKQQHIRPWADSGYVEHVK